MGGTNCQIIVIKPPKYSIVCAPTAQGAEAAVKGNDLINYNRFMLNLYQKHVDDAAIFDMGKQGAGLGHCQMFAANNALGYNVFDAEAFSAIQSQLSKGKQQNVYTFFAVQCVPGALQLMGIKYTVFGRVSASTFLQQQRTNPTSLIGSIYVHSGVYVMPDTGERLEVTHLFAFKFIGGQWYGFDANFEKHAGPFNTFDKAVTSTFTRHNKIRFKNQPEFQINIDGILKPKLSDQTIPHDNGFAALTRLNDIEPYPYATSTSKKSLSFGGGDGVAVETEIILMIAAWMFMIACLCCVFGILFGGWLGHKTKSQQKTNTLQIVHAAPV